MTHETPITRYEVRSPNALEFSLYDTMTQSEVAFYGPYRRASDAQAAARRLNAAWNQQRTLKLPVTA